MKRGSRHTPETRARMAAAKRGRTHTPETRARIAAAKRAASPLAHLSPAQRVDYDVLREKGGMSRAEALAMLGLAP